MTISKMAVEECNSVVIISISVTPASTTRLFVIFLSPSGNCWCRMLRTRVKFASPLDFNSNSPKHSS